MRARIVVVVALWVTAAGCGDGHAGRGGTATFTPSASAAGTATPDASSRARPATLGQDGFLPGRVGWGDAHPDRLDVGGDPALVITRIRWHGWGSPHARAVGRGPAFNLLGGSAYRRQVRVELHADGLGRCAAAD